MKTNLGEERLVKVIEVLLRELRPGANLPVIHHNSDLENDLGIDSLGRAELLVRVENEFNISFPNIILTQTRSVGDLAHAINDATGKKDTVSKNFSIDLTPRHSGPEPVTATTWLEVVDFYANTVPNEVFIHYLESDDKTVNLTFGELAKRSRQLAAGLLQQGLSGSSTVAIMLPTSLEFFYTFFGCLYAGMIPVPLYPPDRPSQIEDYVKRQASILNNSQAKILVTLSEGKTLAKLLGTLAKELKFVDTAEELMKSPPTVHLPKVSGDNVAFIQYTSGSTGYPKGVVLTHSNLLANVRAMGARVGASAQDVFVSWLPLYHDMGLIGAGLGSLLFGSRLVLMSPLSFLARPLRWLRAISDYHGTFSAAPNFAYELCSTRIPIEELRRLNLKSWRMAFCGAEPVSSETVKKFSNRFTEFGFNPNVWMPVYGLAENSLGVTMPEPGRPTVFDCVSRIELSRNDKAKTTTPSSADALTLVGCGVPIAGHELRVVDASNREVREREIGRIQFRGPSATQGYYRNPQATQKLIQPSTDRGLPWLDSGDLGYLAFGQLFITGRSKDLIIRAGTHLFPEEIEEQISGIESVRKGCVAVFGVQDEKAGTEKIVVVAESRTNEKAKQEELKLKINQLCVQKAGAAPDEIVIAPPRSVLKTSSGKIRRNATKEAYLNGQLGTHKTPWIQWAHLFKLGFVPIVALSFRRLKLWVFALTAWLGLFLLLGLALPGIIFLPRLSWRLYYCSFLIRYLFRFLGIKIERIGGENLSALDKKVLVSNHSSYIDAMAIVAAFPGNYHFVAKKEFERHSIFGPLMRRLGCLFVERFKTEEAIAASKDMDKILKTNSSLFVFPEGTFTRQTGLRPFHVGAFMAAATDNTPVVPMALSGSREILREGNWFPRPGRVKVTVYDPIYAKSSDWSGAIDLRDRAKGKILEGCGEPELW